MNVTGVWRFYEEFNGGYDLGYATLIQKGDDVSGSLVYTEYIENEDPFVIAIDVVGEVYSERLQLIGQSYEIVDGNPDIHYCLDERMAIILDDSKMEGHSVDDQNIEGRFLLKRLGLTDI